MKQASKRRPIRRRSDAKAPPAPGLVTRADAARLRGCTPGGVTRACAKGGPLEPAVRGRFIDTTHPAFQAWVQGGDQSPAMRVLRVRRLQAQVEEAELDLEERRGVLIPRKLVAETMLRALNELNMRLLTAAPATLVARARAAPSPEEARRIIVELVSAELAVTKRRIADSLRSVGGSIDDSS